mgnify:CR=1 FL=1
MMENTAAVSVFRFVQRSGLALLLAILCVSLWVAGAYAEVTAEPRTQALVDELRAVTEKSREKRSADPWLQQELEGLIKRYDWPWSKTLHDEDFSAEDHELSADWKLDKRRFELDEGDGLRSEGLPNNVQPEKKPQDSSADLAEALVDELFKKIDNDDDDEPAQEPAEPAGPAVAWLPVKLPNTVALYAEIIGENKPAPASAISFLLYNGENRDAGYLLRLAGGTQPDVELLRIQPGKSAVIDSKTLTDPVLVNGDEHRISLRRNAEGAMDVLLNEEPLFQVVDKRFDHFDGVEYQNVAGNNILKRLVLYGQ